MRTSYYLNTVEIGQGKALLYNGFTLCMDVVPVEVADRLVSSAKEEDFSFLIPAEREHLIQRGHLTTLSVPTEQEALRKLALALAQRDDELKKQPFSGKMITFVLTYRCNLSCAYCYQNEIRKTTSLSSMDDVFVDEFFSTYLDKLVPQTPKRHLSFLLYGGEPLLSENRPAIERILRYAQKEGITVSTVTNSVLLPQMLDLIGPEKGKINNVQVTLDGGRMFHDRQRFSRSGGPTFEQTIQAVRQLMKVGANALIRIHLHPDRFESAKELVTYLQWEKILGHERVKVYFWSAEDFHRRALAPGEDELFSRLFQDVALGQNSLPTAHFAFLEQILEMESARHLPVMKHCSICVTGLHWVVDALGDLYECIDDAGRRDRRIASLADGKINTFSRSQAYEKPHLCDKPECLKCSLALFCGGGCVNRFRAQNNSQPEMFCLQIKEFIELTLRSYFHLKKNIPPHH